MTENRQTQASKFGDVVLPDGYVEFSPLLAEIQIDGSRRGFAMDATFMIAFHRFLQDTSAENWPALMSDAGYAWGTSSYEKIEKLALEVFPEVKNIKELNMSRFHQLFTNHLASMGWGNFELKRRDNFLFVDLYDSFIVHALKQWPGREGGRASAVCHLYAGFFGGVFSRISNMKLACLEITCEHDGFENCSFLLDNSETIELIGRKIRAGASPLEAYQKARKEIEEQYLD